MFFYYSALSALIYKNKDVLSFILIPRYFIKYDQFYSPRGENCSSNSQLYVNEKERYLKVKRVKYYNSPIENKQSYDCWEIKSCYVSRDVKDP